MGRPGPSGFGSASTAEQVTEGVDASNLTAIVTGGASGIGFETARVLALRRAHVIIAARNIEAANEAKQAIIKENISARVDVLKLDLCSLKSVRAFVDSFNALDLPLNLLINNAGVMFCPHQLSEDGVEVQFATNHLEGRIVILSSLAHTTPYQEGIRFDKINNRIGYSELKAYGQSKLANLLHSNELSRRLQRHMVYEKCAHRTPDQPQNSSNHCHLIEARKNMRMEEGVNITVNSVHPGLIMTPLMRHSPLLMKTFKLFTFWMWKNVPQGAATTSYVALHPKMKGVTGKYFVDCNELKPSSHARDEKLAKKLWTSATS
ncbi:NAD(P)-binding Rossmann-fold superfamily protein [Prunus dulcis]|uniref:NAD(P)-binding Rossmann-fold superfamily protein n=1 Tax=Prunus dulcis TaxID=3755 RepID=A0A4Y1RQG7_PRUDU|nr:NAD(P)-binding Rossmann-fold superfamily protein [Prunus dulcis]